MTIYKHIVSGISQNGDPYHWESDIHVGKLTPPESYAQEVNDLWHAGVEACAYDQVLTGSISIPLGQDVPGLDWDKVTYSEVYVTDGYYARNWSYSEGNATLNGWEIIGN